jgi:serine/threonine-protein kinase ATR
MLESTFSIVIEHWDTFDQDIKNVAIMSLQYLIDERGRLIRNTIVNLPSLGQFSQLSEIEGQINKWRQGTDIGNGFQIYSRRIAHENSGVVLQALVELKEYLCLNQDFLQSSAISEQPDPVVGGLVRSILDISVRFSGSHTEISILSAECIGLIGCLDSNRVESVREQREMVVVSNFEDAGETTDFVLFILEEVIVKAFLSATDTVWQGFLSYVMQELLWKCDFKEICAPIIASGKKNYDNPIWQKWCTLPIGVRNTLTPFLTSKYLMLERDLPKYTYPIFSPENMLSDKIYNVWLRAFVLDLLQKSLNVHASVIFPPLCRAIRIKDISIASFLLPYVALHTILLGSDEHRREIGEELLRVLSYEPETNLKVRREELKLCTEVGYWTQYSVFRLTRLTGSISCARLSFSLGSSKDQSVRS